MPCISFFIREETTLPTMQSTPGVLNLASLEEQILAYLRNQGAYLGMGPSKTRICYVLNTDNFTNFNFQATDGARTIHIKLSNDSGHHENFRRWRRCREILENRYRAPGILGTIELPDSGCEGLVLQYVPGTAADLSRPSPLLEQVIALTDRLHNDRAFAESLAENEPSLTYADSFLQTYGTMWREDLRVIRAGKPDFLAAETLDWMDAEVTCMEVLVRESPDFAGLSSSVIHGDLSPANILSTPEGDWHIIDWDDLQLGDPAIDTVMLLWPLLVNSGLRSAGAKLPIPAHDSRFIKRMLICIRAQVLTGIVDSLADYVECIIAPEDQDRVRAMKKKAHEENLELYRKRFLSQ